MFLFGALRSGMSPAHSRRLAEAVIVCICIVCPLFAQEGDSGAVVSAKTRDEQSREIAIERARLEMELAENLMKEKQIELENLQAMMREENNIVTVSEVNRAEEEHKRAIAEYEKAKLNLQQVELDSLKDAWHITVESTRLYESRDGRELFSITLRNSSLPVTLTESSKVLGRAVVVSAQVDDIFVSIKEAEDYGRSGAIIAEPYQRRIETLKEGEAVTLEFELIKEDVRSVIVELDYLDIVDERNIHLKQEDPYISVVSARRYKEGDRRRLEVILTYGAVTSTDEAAADTDAQPTAQEINNVYVAIKDDTEAIIGYPYEHRIPTLKDGQEKLLDFELRRNVDSLTVNLRYLDKDYPYKIHLEEDTRYISILSAKKFRVDSGTGGQMMVTLQLKNTSTTEAMPMNATPAEIAAANEIRSIYVSLLDVTDDTNIVKPYEAKIPVLGYNETVDLTFQLQKDVESLKVSLNYPELTEPDRRLIYLQKESALDVVNVSSLRFSQEGNLGSSVTYDLTLDRLAETENTFQLRVINLLNRLTFEFQDPETQSRQSQVKFTQEQSKRQLQLIVYLPEELDAVYLDNTLEFYVAVLDEVEANALGGGGNNRLDLAPERIAGIQGGIERFELIPKGVPEIELFVPNAFQTIQVGEPVQLTATLKNIGTRDLVDIRMVVEVNTEWHYTVSPTVIRALKRNEETEIQVALNPPADISVGEYEAKLNAEVTVENRKVEARERSITVKVESQTQLSITTLLFVALILLVIGIAIVTIRISRR